MGFRKFKADAIFTGKQVLPSDKILITQDNGTVIDVADERDSGEDVEKFHGLLSPGFVNTHCHLELSHMKGCIPPGSGLVHFLTKVMRERALGTAEILEAMKAAESELFNTGTVAVADICNTTVSLEVKPGSRLRWRNFIEVMGFNDENAQYRFSAAEKILDAFGQDGEASLTPHAPYSVSRTLFGMINQASAGKTITIHNQESLPENRLYEAGQGEMFDLYADLGIDASAFNASFKTSLQTFLPWLDKPSDILLVHNTYSSEADILFALSHLPASVNVFFCLCINANRYIEEAIPPVELLRKCKAVVTMGTDSYASNWQLNMLEEIKSIQDAFAPKVPLAEILQWATFNGAKALRMDDQLGSFEPGRQPGVVLIDKLENGMVAKDALAKRIL